MSASALTLLAAATTLNADIVETTDGSRLVGEITQVSGGVLVLETAYAGSIEIPVEQVVTFSSEDAETVRLSNGNVAVGSVSGSSDGTISVSTAGGTVTAATSEVAAAWQPGDRDPDVIANEAALEGQLRKWSYEAAVGISGKSGNTSKSDFNGSAAATLEGPSDRLNMYVQYQYAKAEGVATSDEIVGGMSYTSFFSDHFGWYVREELERDRFENISFRSTSAAGLNYRAIKTNTRRLEFTAGLSLRYEGYYTGDPSSDSFPGLDFGVKHYWKITDWLEMNNIVTYNPAFDDILGDYRVDHKSTLDLPLGTADYWKLRVSLENQYSSNPTVGLDKLDTTYGLSLLLNWK
jgi:putative salt-induced outer membrane protein YdiY